MPKIQPRTRLASIDSLRLISILGVILIHTTTRSLELVHLNITLLPLTFFFNQISRFAVPLFFLISGFTCELSFNKNRFTKIIIPYLFWSFIYYYFIYTRHSGSFISGLFDGSASYQLYFIPSLLILYILFPILHLLYNFFTRKIIFISLALIQIYLLYTTYFLHPLPLYYPINIAVLNLFVFLFGMWSSHHQLQIINFSTRFKPLLISTIVILSIYIAREGWNNYLNSFNFQAFYTQWRVSIFFYTLGIFILIFNLLKNSRYLFPLSKLSFFVFFIHVWVLEKLTPYFGRSGFWLFVSVTAISFIIAFPVHKIPKLHLLTG